MFKYKANWSFFQIDVIRVELRTRKKEHLLFHCVETYPSSESKKNGILLTLSAAVLK